MSAGSSSAAACGCRSLPAVQPGHRLGLAGRAGDLDQRHRRAARGRSGRSVVAREPAAPRPSLCRPRTAGRSSRLLGCTRGCSPACFSKCGGHGASGSPAASSAAASSSSRSSEPTAASMPSAGSPISAYRRGTGVDGERGRIAAWHLVPAQRRRHPGVRRRPDGVGRGDGPVLGVLVVVDEDAVPLFLPPARGRLLRRAALDLPGQRDGGAAGPR